MNKVYVIECQHRASNETKVSWQGFSSLRAAQVWVKKRSDKPQEIHAMLYMGDEYYYSIIEVEIAP